MVLEMDTLGNSCNTSRLMPVTLHVSKQETKDMGTLSFALDIKQNVQYCDFVRSVNSTKACS